MLKRLVLPLALATPAAADAPRVVTDIAPMQSLAAMVMGDLGSPEMLIDPSVSPHHANLRPSQAAALQDADLVFMIGEELTPWLSERMEALAGDARVVTFLDGSPVLIEPGKVAEDGHDDHKEGHHDEHDDHDDHEGHDHAEDHAEDKDHDHAQAHEDGHEDGHDDGHEDGHEDGHKDGHDHDDHAKEEDHAHEDGHEDHGDEDAHGHEGHAHAIDPHAWLDPQNAVAWLGKMGSALGAADPENAATYTQNAVAAMGEIGALMGEIEASTSTYNGSEYIAFHDAYSYFSQRWGYKSAGSLASNEGVAPSAADIKAARAEIEEGHVSCLFTEAQFGPDIVGTVAEGFDVKVVELDPLGAKLEQGPELYKALLGNIAQSFAECLS